MIPTHRLSTLIAITPDMGYHAYPVTLPPEPPRAVPEITQLLTRMSAGSLEARDEVWGILHEQLHRRAGREARGSHGLLEATELISIAFTRVDRLGGKDWASRRHFIAVAALAMRSAVVDHLRRDGSKGEREPLDEVVEGVAARVDGDVLGFYDELDAFAKADPVMAHALELKALGYEATEIAEHLGMPERSFYRHFDRARAHLQKRMQWRQTSGNE